VRGRKLHHQLFPRRHLHVSCNRVHRRGDVISPALSGWAARAAHRIRPVSPALVD
jgi:hypothetical protein